MRLCVTGVAGFLGSHLADRFIEGGHSVIGNDTMMGGDYDNVPSAIDRFEPIDCVRTDRMVRLMQDCDVVVHCAATAHEGLSVFSPAFVTRNIFQASVSVFSAAIQAGVRRIVFCSSMARYGGQEPPFTEDMTPKPVDPYGVAKAAAEDVLRLLSKTHGVQWNIAVPHNIIGPRQCYTDPYRNVVSIMANRNLRGLPAIIYGDGSQTRCFSDVTDCVDALEALAFRPTAGEVVNIGPDRGEVTILELADLVAEETGFTGGVLHFPDRPCEVKHARCSSDKLRRLFNLYPRSDLTSMIRFTVDSIRERGPKPFCYERLPVEIVSHSTPKTWSDQLI